MTCRHLIVVPAIDLELTAGLLATIDPALAKERVLIIDNTDDGRLTPIVRRCTWITNHENAGVAATWNQGARLAFADHVGATFVTLLSTSIRFTDGARGLCRTADLAAENGQWRYGFESLRGWHCITLGRATFDAVGWFDENFWPAYMEDSDMIWRLRLAGIMEPAGGDRSLRKIPWVGALEPDLVGVAQSMQRQNIVVDFAALAHYYVEKWGGLPGNEAFTHPFGDAANRLDYWSPVGERVS